jgi:hypothetical protein
MHSTVVKIIPERVSLSRKAVINTCTLTAAFILFSHNFLKWELLGSVTSSVMLGGVCAHS